MDFKHRSETLKDLPKKIHVEIPFTICLSTESEKPNPFKDEIHHFKDSNKVVYQVR